MLKLLRHGNQCTFSRRIKNDCGSGQYWVSDLVSLFLKRSTEAVGWGKLDRALYDGF